MFVPIVILKSFILLASLLLPLMFVVHRVRIFLCVCWFTCVAIDTRARVLVLWLLPLMFVLPSEQPSLLLPLMLVMILPFCSYCRWFPYWFHHIIGLVIDIYNGCLALLFSPLMPVLISSSFSYCSVIIINCSWCSCWLCSIIARVVGVHADFITSLILQIVVEE